MIRAGTSFSQHKVAEEAAREAAQKALQKAGLNQADAVIFFSSTKYRRHYSDILRTLKEVTGAKTILGSSAYGVLTEEASVERQASLGVLVFSSDQISTQSFLVPNLQESSFAAGEAVGLALRETIQSQLLMIFPDPFSFQSHHFFDGFESTYGYTPMIGGAAAEDGRESKTYQMNDQTVAFDAVCGLALGGNFRFETAIAHSCRPFGEPFRITRAQGNAIYEMDGRPAYDILLETISHIEFKDPDKILQHIFLGVPLKNFQTDFSGDHYLVRNIMGVNAKKGMLTCTSPVEEGEFITFTFRDPNLARQDLKMTLEDLKARLGESKPAMGFYFNCCARGETLYGKSIEDVSLIRKFFPELPLLGFFTYGELAPVDHVNHLHFHSGVLSLICES